MSHTNVRHFSHLFSIAWFMGAFVAGLVGLSACTRPATPNEADAKPINVNISVAPPRARVGDPLRLEVQCRFPAEGRVEWPEPSSVFEIRRRQEKTTARPRLNRRETRVIYDALCFEIGRHRVFPGAFVYVAPDGTRHEISPPDTEVEIVSILDEGVQGPRDIKPPIPWPAPWPRWIWALPIVILVAVMAALLIRQVIRRRVPGAPPPPPPEQVALEALAHLRARGWIDANAVEPFYVELSRIIREYIEARFGLRAPEQTTEEFLREAAISNALTSAHRALLADFLGECDEVKFAQARPDADQMRRACDTAERFVRETAPPAAAPQSAGQTSSEGSA